MKKKIRQKIFIFFGLFLGALIVPMMVSTRPVLAQVYRAAPNRLGPNAAGPNKVGGSAIGPSVTIEQYHNGQAESWYPDPTGFDFGEFEGDGDIGPEMVHPPRMATGWTRTIYSVGVRNVSWRRNDGAFSVTARVYSPVTTQGPVTTGVSEHLPYSSDRVSSNKMSGGEKHPVVIFSHGLGTSSERFDYLGNMWASRGIVSIHLNHPGSDESQWRGRLRPINELKDLYKRYWSGRDRALMIRFVIDRITEMAGRPGTVAESIDPSRIGVGGNDLGALAALLVAGQLPPDNGESLYDPRVTAVLALSPPVYCDRHYAPAVYGGVHIPFLSVAGTADDGIVGTTKAPQRRIPFESMSGNDRYHITLLGGDHLVYGGHIRVRKQGNDAVYQDAIRSVSLLFWSAYLLADPQAKSLLDNARPTMLSNVGKLERALQ